MSEAVAPRLFDIVTAPWAILEKVLLEIQAVYFAHLRGEKIDIQAIEAKLGKPLANEQKPYDVIDNVAVIPIEGIVAKRMNLMTRISGGVSTQILQQNLKEALADESVKAILLDIDSPGGTVDGTENLAADIFRARSTHPDKPIVAYTDGMMASAAYWIGASAQRVYISGDTPIVGSIGVVTSHVDYSQYEQKIGIKTTEVYAGKYKRITSEYSPLSQEGRQYLQDQVDTIYSIFVDRVASARSQKLSIPTEGSIPWAEGKIFTGKQAFNAGLVDGVSTRSALIHDLSTGGAKAIRYLQIEEEINERRRIACQL
jgi:signal peptide peptidase SppA